MSLNHGRESFVKETRPHPSERQQVIRPDRTEIGQNRGRYS
jgi:hypothetical protein